MDNRPLCAILGPMSDTPEFASFEEFWPFYVREHSSKTNRRLHFAGTSLALGCVATAVVMRKPLLLLAAPVLGYGGAWVGHFFVEKNRPATFKYPLWSLMGDFKMYGMILRGRMDEEVERVLRDYAAKAAEAEAKTDGAAPPAPAPAN